ncbi:DUF6046 domain-containing protein [Weeksella virosa]|uniref:DUF6046 domain-containing protein n=1 Tax=Weeksella virosa TaxID=1014 RepID=UPI00255459F5|nr:DUF6046 domain-containing protein [Weeksella virosa]MDK7376066.1 DUF6046 domain-containing protein [Weeksella virosa]MDK7674394.1 DUF6046 domain-containing protein [Weeksella virosa]
MLIASLLGSKVVEQIPRFEQVENYLETHVGVPIPFLPIRNEVVVRDAERFDVQDVWNGPTPISKENQFFPFSFKKSDDTDWYLLPWEPMVNIEARNILTKRYVAKNGNLNIGSIKERWSADDYDITITGTLFGMKERGKVEETYPRKDMERLRDYLLAPEALEILCEPLQILGISRIVVESMSFPFTKGENVQAYEIKAVSDFEFNLLIEK